MKKLTIKEILDAVNGKLIAGNEEAFITGVSTDSREVKAGDAFFAIKGVTHDAHKFLGMALENGCETLIISDDSKLPTADVLKEKNANVVLVEDTLKALQMLAKYYIGTLPLKKKIAVTGSVGKTSTRDMLYYVASTKYRTGRNMKNYNNELGLPLTVLALDEDLEVVVLEMGMDSFGEIDTLADIVRPDIAVITNVGISHIENLGSREGILKAKMEITNYFNEDSVLIVNQSCDMLEKKNVEGNYRTVTVGKDGKSEFIVSNVCDFGDKGIKYTLDRNHKQYEVSLPLPGAHNALNATLAVAAGEVLGISTEDAIKGLAEAQLTARRLNIRGKDGIKVIDDSYNACPDSMKSAVNTLVATKGIRKVAVLGDMYELGPDSNIFHREVGEYAGEKNVDLLVAVGADGAENLAAGAREKLGNDKVMYFATKAEFLADMDKIIGPGDVVLVKASLGMAMDQIVKAILKEN